MQHGARRANLGDVICVMFLRLEGITFNEGICWSFLPEILWKHIQKPNIVVTNTNFQLWICFPKVFREFLNTWRKNVTLWWYLSSFGRVSFRELWVCWRDGTILVIGPRMNEHKNLPIARSTADNILRNDFLQGNVVLERGIQKHFTLWERFHRRLCPQIMNYCSCADMIFHTLFKIR